jgi:gluconolactonase
MAGDRIPAQRQGEENAMAEIRVIADGLRFPEGPVAMADGSVVLGEIAGSAVTRIAPNGAKTGLGRGWQAQRPRARSDGPELYAAREAGL